MENPFTTLDSEKVQTGSVGETSGGRYLTSQSTDYQESVLCFC